MNIRDMRSKKNKVGARHFETFDDKELAQKRVDELESEGRTIYIAEWHPLMKKWVIGT